MRKKIIVTFGGLKQITIPEPEEIRVSIRGTRKFDFRLKTGEHNLRNLVQILKKSKRAGRK